MMEIFSIARVVKVLRLSGALSRLHTQDQPRDASKTPGHKIQYPSEYRWLNIPSTESTSLNTQRLGHESSMEIPCEPHDTELFCSFSLTRPGFESWCER